MNALKYGALDYITKAHMDESKIKDCLDKVLQIRDGLLEKKKRGRVAKIAAEIGVLSAVFFLQRLFSKI